MKEDQESQQEKVVVETQEANLHLKFNPVIHYAIQLLALAILIIWCYRIIEPFVTLLVWGTVIAIALYPTHKALSKRLGNREYWSAGIISFSLIAMIVVPAAWLLFSTVKEVKGLADMYQSGQFVIQQPSVEIKSWPIVGNTIYNVWLKASTNLNELVLEYSDVLKKVAFAIFSLLANTGKAVFLFFGSIVISGALLAFSKPVSELIRSVFVKLIGQQGEEYTTIAASTVRSVAKGVLGVSLIQSILAGIGMVVAGIPFAGLWIVLCVILSIVQIGVFPVSIGVMIYIWTTGNTTTAILLTIWMLFVGVSDNILKPFLLGKGTKVPMLIVFIGSIGGFIFSGFIGLFTGAIVLSLGYKLFNAWLAIKPE